MLAEEVGQTYLTEPDAEGDEEAPALRKLPAMALSVQAATGR